MATVTVLTEHTTALDPEIDPFLGLTLSVNEAWIVYKALAISNPTKSKEVVTSVAMLIQIREALKALL